MSNRRKHFQPGPSELHRLLHEQTATDPEHFFDPFDEKATKGFPLIIFDTLRTMTSYTLIISLPLPQRFETKSIETYSKDEVRRLRLSLIFYLVLRRSHPPSYLCR